VPCLRQVDRKDCFEGEDFGGRCPLFFSPQRNKGHKDNRLTQAVPAFLTQRRGVPPRTPRKKRKVEDLIAEGLPERRSRAGGRALVAKKPAAALRLRSAQAGGKKRQPRPPMLKQDLRPPNILQRSWGRDARMKGSLLKYLLKKPKFLVSEWEKRQLTNEHRERVCMKVLVV